MENFGRRSAAGQSGAADIAPLGQAQHGCALSYPPTLVNRSEVHRYAVSGSSISDSCRTTITIPESVT
jgi:hypothetical protein